MVKLVELNDLNILDSIQVSVNERGGVSQEQRSILENPPSLLASILKRLWSDISYLGIFLIGLVLLIAIEASSIFFTIFTILIFLLAVGLAFIHELPAHRKRIQIQKDITSTRVKQGLGTIVFHDEALHGDIGERKLILPRTRNGLLPGVRYRFFYLDESGIVLTAEKIESLGEEIEKQSYQEILLQANRFNLDGLISNRKGRLIFSRQSKLFFPNIITGGVIILGFAGISAYFFRIYLDSFASADGANLLSLICGSGSILIGIAGVLTFGRSALDLLRGKVSTVSGIGRKAARMARRKSSLGRTQAENPISYYYEIGDVLFRVNEPACNAFINDIRYTAYYTPFSKTLVGIEPLESPLRAKSSN